MEQMLCSNDWEEWKFAAKMFAAKSSFVESLLCLVKLLVLLCPGIPQSEIFNHTNNKQFLEILYGVIPWEDLTKALSGGKFMKELL